MNPTNTTPHRRRHRPRRARRILSSAAVAGAVAGLTLGLAGAAHAADGPLPGFSPPPKPSTPGFTVRAMGDSVTAGFGFDRAGNQLNLNPAESNPQKSIYACSKKMPTNDCDGLNLVSYGARWVTEHGVANFDNRAESGSTPEDWDPSNPNARNKSRLEKVAADNPDMVLMTLGANPFVGKLMNAPWGGESSVRDCANQADPTKCVNELLDEVQVTPRLKRIYTYLLTHTAKTRVIVMEYPSSRPPVLAGNSDVLLPLLNGRIEQAVREVRETNPSVADRITTVKAPQNFNQHGLKDWTGMFAFEPVRWQDGRELWVLNGDGGIHPNKAGMEEMAAQIEPAVWGRLPDRATLIAREPSTIAGSSANVAAVIDPRGETTAYGVEYGPSAGNYTNKTARVEITNPDSGPQEYGQLIDRLQANTTYHYRFVVTQQRGNDVKTTYGPDQVLTTAPVREDRTAVASDRFRADGAQDIAYRVEYGTTTAYGETTKREYAGQPNGEITLTQVLDHLKPGTTYHYRFVVTVQKGNTVDTVRLPDRTVTTVK
jgi:lysophospholipase L1-like esterase